MSTSKLSSKSASAGLLAAIVASLCCITPVFSLFAGIGGIAAAFSWMEPFRPYLIALTIGVLGFAWYQKLKPKTAEEIACACDEDEKPSFLQSRKFLGIATIFASLMLAFPSYSHVFYAKPDQQAAFHVAQDSAKTYQIVFVVKGMTCSGCEAHVTNAVSEIDGVFETIASYEKGNTLVKFDPKKVSEKKIVEAINATGYKVIEKPNLK